MSNISDLPWPLCLGTFDEESCRFFLHETGARIVPNYPFTFGMEEVYGLILDRYGFKGTPDVTSLLRELLEDNQNASGYGDDGDIWRSWRHGWRHRNDDALNPFIPRFGPLVLQPSTTPQLRILKANNFIRMCEGCCARADGKPSQQTLDLDESANCKTRMSEIVTTCKVPSKEIETIQSTKLKTTQSYPNRSVSKGRGKHFSFVEKEGSQSLRHQSSLHFIAPISNSSALREALVPVRNGWAQLRGGDHIAQECLKTNVNSQTAEEALNPLGPSAVVSAAEAHRDTVSRIPCVSDFSNSSGLLINSGLECQPLSRVGYQIEGKPDTDANRKRISREVHLDTLWNVVQVTESPTSGNHQQEQQEQQEQQVLTLGHRRRAANRQAQLIDGTIFTSKNRRLKVIGLNQAGATSISNESSTKASARSSWSSIRHRNSLRENLTREIGRLFNQKRHEKHASSSSKHRSVLLPPKSNIANLISNMPTIFAQSRPRSPNSDTKPVRRQFGFDGTSDQPPSKASQVDLNKPLPLSPEEIIRSLSSRSQLTYSHYSEITSDPPSTGSTATSVSRSSSKKDFRGLTSHLLQPEMHTNRELPPIREIDSNIRGDSQRPPAPAASSISYTSIAKGNPFSERAPLRSPKKPPPLYFGNGKWKSDILRLEQSGFEPMIDIDAQNVRFGRPDDYSLSLSHLSSTNSTQLDKENTLAQGRSRGSPELKSHTKQEIVLPKSPAKRSSSPVKKFLGLSKSHSANKLEDFELPARPKTPKTPGSTKESLKKWGDRFRYGFLTPDQEQLRQEELIEAHNNDSTTSTPQNSTFPISLEPPLQAKIQSEIELIIVVTANRYLLRETRAGRLSGESVAKTKELWEKLNRPQVTEFHYDQITQHNLVLANMDRVKLFGDAATDPIAINSTMRGWKIMAREMSIRTFCCPDSVIRKHLHDAHRVLELLGAPLVTFLAYEDMQLKTLATISQRQKERMARRAGSADRNVSSTSTLQLSGHRRNASEGSYQHQEHDYSDYPITSLQMDKISLSPTPTPIMRSKVRKATGAEGAIMSLPVNFERSREGHISKVRTARTDHNKKEV